MGVRLARGGPNEKYVQLAVKEYLAICGAEVR
jgi:hypothetical protein